MALLVPDKNAEPLELPRTGWAVGVYALLAALLALVMFLLMASTAYREGTGLTLLEAQRRTRAVLPLVLGLGTASLLLALQAVLCWRSSRWALILGGLLLVPNALMFWLPGGLQKYVVLLLLGQGLAFGLYLRLRHAPRTA